MIGKVGEKYISSGIREMGWGEGMQALDRRRRGVSRGSIAASPRTLFLRNKDGGGGTRPTHCVGTPAVP